MVSVLFNVLAATDIPAAAKAPLLLLVSMLLLASLLVVMSLLLTGVRAVAGIPFQPSSLLFAGVPAVTIIFFVACIPAVMRHQQCF
jgi:hypothetical protein